MSKALRVKISALAGLFMLLLAVVVTVKVMHPDTFVFWFIAEAVGAVVTMFGVNDALRKEDICEK